MVQAACDLPEDASFEDYLAMEFPEDDVRETFIDPLSLKGAPKAMAKDYPDEVCTPPRAPSIHPSMLHAVASLVSSGSSGCDRQLHLLALAAMEPQRTEQCVSNDLRRSWLVKSQRVSSIGGLMSIQRILT